MTLEYYNNFYKELAEIDGKDNNSNKIKAFSDNFKTKIKILDIGCGFGSVSGDLVKSNHIVHGIEINTDAISACEKKGIVIISNDLKNIDKIEDKYDCILLLDILEHIMEPLDLIAKSSKLLSLNGQIIVSVPLYFDIFDRLKILFTGSVISIDNLSYGKELYKRFRSYNYDHIRFFRPKDMSEMGEIHDLYISQLTYKPGGYFGKNKILRFLSRLVSNKYSAKLLPNLLAHSMIFSWQKK
jgi:SAM-dependent methyltransferase